MRSMKTHPLNVSYLVVGLIFLGLAGSWALRESGVIDLLGEPLELVTLGRRQRTDLAHQLGQLGLELVLIHFRNHFPF